MGVVEASSCSLACLLGVMGDQLCQVCLFTSPRRVLQVHKCFELLYIRELTDTNGVNVVVAEGLRLAVYKRDDVTTQSRRVSILG